MSDSRDTGSDMELRDKIESLLIFHAGWDVGAHLDNEVNDWIALFESYAQKRETLAQKKILSRAHEEITYILDPNGELEKDTESEAIHKVFRDLNTIIDEASLPTLENKSEETE